jgi:hypothetical protein
MSQRTAAASRRITLSPRWYHRATEQANPNAHNTLGPTYDPCSLSTSSSHTRAIGTAGRVARPGSFTDGQARNNHAATLSIYALIELRIGDRRSSRRPHSPGLRHLLRPSPSVQIGTGVILAGLFMSLSRCRAGDPNAIRFQRHDLFRAITDQWDRVCRVPANSGHRQLLQGGRSTGAGDRASLLGCPEVGSGTVAI